MKKLLILVSALALVFTSCSNDDDDTSSNTSSPVLLTKTVETYDDGSTLTTNFSYSGNKLISIDDSDGETDTFSYDSNGRLISIVENYYNGAGTLVSNTVSITYNTDGTINSYEDSLNTDPIEKVTTFTYNSDGTILLKHGSSEEYLYTIQNGNIISEIGQGPTSGYNFEYTYDVKNQPFKNVHQAIEVLQFLYYFSNNNCTSITLNNDSSHEESSVSSYVYNSINYPTASLDTYGDGSTTSTQYFYNQ